MNKITETIKRGKNEQSLFICDLTGFGALHPNDINHCFDKTALALLQAIKEEVESEKYTVTGVFVSRELDIHNKALSQVTQLLDEAIKELEKNV